MIGRAQRFSEILNSEFIDEQQIKDVCLAHIAIYLGDIADILEKGVHHEKDSKNYSDYFGYVHDDTDAGTCKDSL